MRADITLKMAAFVSAAVFLLIIAAGSVAGAVEDPGAVGNTDGGEGTDLSPRFISRQISNFFQGLTTPERKSRILSFSSSYDPDFNISSVYLAAAALYDHGNLWDRTPSGNTVFKLEATAGSMVRPERKAVASANMLAMYYPRVDAPTGYRPYLEAGIGVIYTDYRVAKQDYRLNFNPQLGIGTEMRGESGTGWFAAVRLNHISNCDIGRYNRGVNSLLLQIGHYF